MSFAASMPFESISAKPVHDPYCQRQYREHCELLSRLCQLYASQYLELGIGITDPFAGLFIELI